jgi:hypothetical protein
MYLTSIKSDNGPTMSAHEFINYEQKYNLSNPCTPIEEAIINMLDEIDDVDDIQYLLCVFILYLYKC